MKCNELLDQLGEFLDHEARQEICSAIEAHMDKCHDCRLVVDKTRKVIMLYQADRPVEMSPSLAGALQAALAKEYGRPPPTD